MEEDDFCRAAVATFDHVAERYAEKYFHLDLYDRYLSAFAERIHKPGARVLDAACGPGNVSAYLAKHRPDLRLTGIDLAEGMVRQARLRVPGAEFRVHDCRRLDELGQVFDAAAYAFGLSYLTDEDAKRFFAALDTSLATSGVLYLSTMTGEPDWSGFESSTGGDRVYIEYRRVEDVLSMVEAAGYQIDFQELLDSPPDAPRQTRDLVLMAKKRR